MPIYTAKWPDKSSVKFCCLITYPYIISILNCPESLTLGDAGRRTGDLLRGDLGRGDLGRGERGLGDLGRGDLGRGDRRVGERAILSQLTLPSYPEN